MKSNKIQITLPDELMEKFSKEAEKQKRTKSNLVKRYIIEGLANEKEDKR